MMLPINLQIIGFAWLLQLVVTFPLSTENKSVNPEETTIGETSGQPLRISLQQIISEIEASFLHSASNFEKVVYVNKSHSDENAKNQTNSKADSLNHQLPVRIIIDHVVIYPQMKNMSLFPNFELHHDHFESSKASANNIKSNISTDHSSSNENISFPYTKIETPENFTEISTSSDPLSAINNSTPSTKTNSLKAETSTDAETIEELKDAEKKLKEKVAEIEAEPIILSARI